MSDSNYAAATRHRRPQSISGRLPALDIVDDVWAADKLSDDEIDVERHDAAIAPLLDEGDLDVDAVVVSTGQSGSVANGAAERRRREEGRWNDLGLDHFDVVSVGAGSGAVGVQRTGGNSGGGQQH